MRSSGTQHLPSAFVNKSVGRLLAGRLFQRGLTWFLWQYYHTPKCISCITWGGAANLYSAHLFPRLRRQIYVHTESSHLPYIGLKRCADMILGIIYQSQTRSRNGKVEWEGKCWMLTRWGPLCFPWFSFNNRMDVSDTPALLSWLAVITRQTHKNLSSLIKLSLWILTIYCIVIQSFQGGCKIFLLMGWSHSSQPYKCPAKLKWCLLRHFCYTTCVHLSFILPGSKISHSITRTTLLANNLLLICGGHRLVIFWPATVVGIFKR